MNSMLQQAPTILKAIEQAWNNSGRPSEFTIKILEYGKKGFLGFASKPVIISISYDPKNQTEKFKKEIYKQDTDKQFAQKGETREREKYSDYSQKEKTQNSQVYSDNQKNRLTREGDKKDSLGINWTKETVEDISFWLEDMIKIMQININFNYKVEQRLLNIFFDKGILKEEEEEKLLFISWSNLLMQFLKKKYRKKFKNFFIIIHSNKNNENGSKQ